MTTNSDNYNALGDSAGFLRASITGETLNAGGRGYHQDFTGGTIY